MSDEDDFGRVMDALAADELMKPALLAALNDPQFKAFKVPVDGWSNRAYDGYFHPSTHAAWPVRVLWLYLIRPQVLIAEKMGITGVLAVTQGSFWHHFLQQVSLDLGFLKRFRPDGEDIHPCEVPVFDPLHNRKGHADGEIVESLRHRQGLEIKTINGHQIKLVNSEEVLKQKKYDYWCQTQDYLDVMEWESMRYLFLHADFPFQMTEFVVHRDPAYQSKRRAQYKQAMELAQRYPDMRAMEDPNLIPVCCTPKSATAKTCPARLVCPVGKQT